MAPVLAATQEAAFKAVRDSFNDGITAADVDGAARDNLVVGEGDLYQKTWYGPTGFHSWYFDDGTNRSTWACATALTKNANQSDGGATPAPATDLAVLAQEQLQDIHGCSKRLWVPASCMIHVEIQAELISPTLSQLGVTYRYPNYSGNTASKAYLVVDGDPKEQTVGYSFEDSIGSAPSGEIDSGLTSSTNDPTKLWARRYYSVFYTFAKQDPGWVDIKMVIDCRNERTFATRRSINIQGYYSV